MSNKSLAAINKRISASLDLPGSKSIANRVLPLAAMARGISLLSNIPEVGEDVSLMIAALKTLGIDIVKLSEQENGCSVYQVNGCCGKLPVASAEIFCGNSGTTLRFLTAMLALLPGNYLVTGVKRMKERPISNLLDALSQIGSQIKSTEKDGYPPLQISPFQDNGCSQIELSGKISSQYLTGLLMALPNLNRDIQIKISDELISKPYVDISLAILKQFAIEIRETAARSYTFFAGQQLQAIEYTVEPDASSASYFLAMGALNGSVQINNLSAASLQGDKNFARVLALMGAEVEYSENYIRCSRSQLNGISINMEDMPDVAMTIAVLAIFANGPSQISGISSWKVKETDRLLAMYTELVKLGAEVSYTDDAIYILPPAQIKQNVAIDTYNDHRMAMCFSLLAVGGIAVTINNYECVGKTFANYFEIFARLVY